MPEGVKRCEAFNIRTLVIFEVQDLVWLHFDSYALIGSREESNVYLLFLQAPKEKATSLGSLMMQANEEAVET